jgi:tetratricopeptide (TPR) repeat protein
LLEDLHWADDGSLDLIEHLARECRSMPLLIVALTRPELFERRATWGEEQTYHTRLELRPLSEQDNRRLVEEILRKVKQIPPHLHALIVERAEGSPFYTEELIKMLVEDEVIVKGEDEWSVAPERLAEMRVPPTLTGVLQARLDGLPQPERETLQRASVVGRIFWDGAVAWLNGKTVELLAALRNKELVFERQASTFIGEQEHIFKHAILHDVAYESVLKRQRRDYHAQVADWLTIHSGERNAEYAGLIGKHYEQAGSKIHAAEWYARAGRQAQDTFAPEAAIDYYQKALEFLPAKAPRVCARRAELYQGLGLMLQWQARFEEATEAYEAMRAAAEMAGDGVAQARAWDELSTVQQLQGNYRAALELAGRAEEIARAAGAPAQEILARALHNKGWVFSELGEAEAAFSLGEQALALSTELDDRRMMADSLNLLGRVQVNVGGYEQATRYIERALELARELDDRMWVGRMLNNLGVIAESRGDYQAAATNYQDALAIARETGNRHGEMVVLNNLGEARVGLGEYQAAETDLRRAIEMAEVAGWGGVSATYCSLAEACLGQNKLTEALELAWRALELGQETKVQEDIGGAWYALGMALAAAPSPAPIAIGEDRLDAVDCFARSLEVFTEAGMEGERARTLRAWAKYEMERGDKKRGEKMLQEAREIFARLGVSSNHP